MALNMKLCYRFRILKDRIQNNILPVLRSNYHSVGLTLNSSCISYTKVNFGDHYVQLVHPAFNRNFKFSAVLFSNSNCWKCGASLGILDVFCLKCKSLQPPNKKLSYFKLFGLQDDFEINVAELSKKFKELQWLLHPDKFSSKSKEEQDYSELYSSLINLGYRTLLHPLSRGLYLLEIKGNPFQDGDILMDQEFLLEMMTINEKIAEATSPEVLKVLALKNSEIMEQVTRNLAKSFTSGNFDSIKIDLARLRYYTNIEEKIKEALLEFHL